MPGSVHDPVSRASYEFTPDGEDLTVETWMEPGGGLPPHEHPRQTEVWYAIDGRVEFRLGKEKRVIGPEDGEMVVPPNTVHGVKAVEDRTVHLGCRVTPALDAPELPRGERRGGQRRPVHEGRDPQGHQGRPVGRGLPGSLRRGDRDGVPAEVRAERHEGRRSGGKGKRAPSATMGGDAH